MPNNKSKISTSDESINELNISQYNNSFNRWSYGVHAASGLGAIGLAKSRFHNSTSRIVRKTAGAGVAALASVSTASLCCFALFNIL